jgi:hypothetical protein
MSCPKTRRTQPFYSLSCLLATKSSKPCIPFDVPPLMQRTFDRRRQCRRRRPPTRRKGLFPLQVLSEALGIACGFLWSFSTLRVNGLVTILGDDVIKTKTYIFVFSLLRSFFFSTFAILGFLRNLAAITYSTLGGRSKELLEEMACTWNAVLSWVLWLASV